MKKKYILFDLDGTLTNPKEGIVNSVVYALESLGLEVGDRENLVKFIGPPLKDSFMEFYGLDNETAVLAIQKYREVYSVRGIFENEVYIGIPELLADLVSQGRILILATSKPAVYARQILDRYEIAKYFTFVSGSELDESRSEKQEVIQYAIDQLNIDINQALMIGDRKFDVFGARKCGIECAGVLFGFGDEKELIDAGADYIVNTISDLTELLKRDL